MRDSSLSYGHSYEILTSLFDVGTFVELGSYTKRRNDENNLEGVICGYGAINGSLTFAFAQESNRTKGAFGERQAKKLSDLYELAMKNGAPIIGVFDSAGAVVYDGASALLAYSKLMKCVSSASGVIPQIAIISGACIGSSAIVASMFDFVVTVKDKSKLYVNSPFVAGDELKDNDFSLKNGASAFCAESEEEALSFVKNILELLPSNNSEGAYMGHIEDDVNREIKLDLNNYTADEIIEQIADNGQFVKVYGKYADTLSVAFASVVGMVTCLLASEPSKKGIIDIKAARVIAKLVSFCDSFNIAMINLIDSEGLHISGEAESQSYSSELARLATAYASSTNPKISVVMNKAYGASFTLLASKELGTDIVYAMPESTISLLSPEASVAFVWNDKTAEKGREELKSEWKEKYASSACACDLGAIDDVIEPGELRKRVCSSLMMLAYKSDVTPRKHLNLPL